MVYSRDQVVGKDLVVMVHIFDELSCINRHCFAIVCCVMMLLSGFSSFPFSATA